MSSRFKAGKVKSRTLPASTVRGLISASKFKELEDNAASDLDDEDEVESYEDLISKYHKCQKVAKKSKSSGSSSSSGCSLYSLNFARYRQQLKGFKKTTTNIQVIGFSDSDSHEMVIAKASKALGVKSTLESLQLLCSGGVVTNSPIGDKPWTLGEFIKNNGGSQNRGKRVWGIDIPYDEVDTIATSLPSTSDSGYIPDTRKRATMSCSTSKESKKMHLDTQSSEIVLSSSEEVKCLGCDDQITVKYSPLIKGKLDTSVVGTGLISVWRMSQLDYVASDATIIKDIQSELTFQPEDQQFFAFEIWKGSTCILGNDIQTGSAVLWDDIQFSVKGNQSFVCKRHQIIQPDLGYASLLVVVPTYGKADYVWEKQEFSTWFKVEVSPRACMLYVRLAGKYRCNVQGQVYEFEVTETENKGGEIPFEQLVIGAVIGRGNFGVVHKAVYNERDVAVKSVSLPPDFNSSCIPKEVEVLRKLDHPHIVHLMGYSIHNNNVMLVMNYIDGENLDSIIFTPQLSAAMSPIREVQLGLQIADAVDYMHKNAVIHRDLKPLNVLVDADYKKAFVCDMGIAKVKNHSKTTTCNGKGPGTYPYMAPELFSESSKHSSAIDIYSLGCLYIELFSHKRVWGDLDVANIMRNVLGAYNQPPKPPDTSNVNPIFQDLLTRMCSLDPNLRPNSSQVVSDLFMLFMKFSDD